MNPVPPTSKPDNRARSRVTVPGSFQEINLSSRRTALRIAMAAALLCTVGVASAQDAASLSLGRAVGVTAVQGVLTWGARDGEARWRWLDWTGARLRLEVTASIWQGDANGAMQGTLAGLGLQPLLRWSFANTRAGRPFVDFGTGPRLWSGTRFGAQQRFGTAFEFGTVLGLGLQREGHDVFLRVEHTSNGGIRRPNPGIDFVLLGMALPLRP